MRERARVVHARSMSPRMGTTAGLLLQGRGSAVAGPRAAAFLISGRRLTYLGGAYEICMEFVEV